MDSTSQQDIQLHKYHIRERNLRSILKLKPSHKHTQIDQGHLIESKPDTA